MLRLPKLEEKLFQLAFMDHESYRLGIFRQKIQTHPQAMLMHSWDSYVRSAHSLKEKAANELYTEQRDRNRTNQIFASHTTAPKSTRSARVWCRVFKKPNQEGLN